MRDYTETIQKGIELLERCQCLQSEKDGIDRPKPGVIDKTKTLDQFAMDVNDAISFMSSLHKLIPLQIRLTEIGRDLEKQGKVAVEYGDSYADAAVNYFEKQLKFDVTPGSGGSPWGAGIKDLQQNHQVFDWREIRDDDYPPVGEWIMTKCVDKSWPDIRSNQLNKRKDGLYYWSSGDDFGDITHWSPMPEDLLKQEV